MEDFLPPAPTLPASDGGSMNQIPLCRLLADHIPVLTVEGHQLVVRPAFRNPPVPYDEDSVGFPDGVQAVDYDDERLAPAQITPPPALMRFLPSRNVCGRGRPRAAPPGIQRQNNRAGIRGMTMAGRTS